MVSHKHAGETMLVLDGLMQSDNIFKKGLRKEFGTITGLNIKEIEDECKNNPYSFGGLGLFIEITSNDDITKMTCVWSIAGREAPLRYNPSTGFPTFNDRRGNPISPISVILTAFGLEETKDLIGTKVKIKRTSTSIRIAPAKKPISKLSDKLQSFIHNGCIEGGAWVFADLFQYDDIVDVITKERMHDLITIYGPVTDNRLYALSSELLEMAKKFRKDDDPIIKKRDIFHLLNAVGDLEITTTNALNKLSDGYPEASKELDILEDKIHEVFLAINPDNIDNMESVDCDHAEEPKKYDLFSLISSISDLEIDTTDKLSELIKTYPKVKSDLNCLQSKIHEIFTNAKIEDVDMK